MSILIDIVGEIVREDHDLRDEQHTHGANPKDVQGDACPYPDLWKSLPAEPVGFRLLGHVVAWQQKWGCRGRGRRGG